MKAKSDEPDQRNSLELPRDAAATFSGLGGHRSTEQRAKRLFSVAQHLQGPLHVAISIDMRHLGDLHDMNYDLEKMCMHAVDCSNGKLVDINIGHFDTDELLAYIADK
ncbi:hypothetical protein SLE2022_299960 [Rubroshorea leprosula]